MTTGTPGANEEGGSTRKKGWPKGKKRKLIHKDINAPNRPPSGYMLFMNDQREIIKQTDPKLGFSEITKFISNKWSQLDASEKQRYLDAAEMDKERYQQELEKYQKTDLYKRYIEEEERARKRLKEDQKQEEQEKFVEEKHIEKYNPLEIPIFTEEFLSHNKGRETELRQLRKSNNDYEEQNAVLEKRIDNVRAAVIKLEVDTSAQKTKNDALKDHLFSLRQTLTTAFSTIQIPDTNETANEDDIDSYITKLHTVLTGNPCQHQKLVNQVKSIVNNLKTS